MPLKFLKSQTSKWPKGYGFEVYGKGPTYVVSVEPGSTAVQAGLAPGDQILEVEGQDVTSMPAAAVKTLARNSRNQPPALEVVACLSHVNVEPQPFSGYGFTVLNERPVVVGSVDFAGPASQAGLRVGDIILEVNGKPPKGVEAMGSLLSQRPGRLLLLTIPVGRSGNMIHVDKGLTRLQASDHRVHRARDLYERLDEVLGNDYDRKLAVVAVLKQYAEDRDIDILCHSLNAILNTPHARTVLKHIRSLVSPQQRATFDERLRTRTHDGFSRVSPTHSSASPTPNTPAIRAPPTHTLGTKKVIQVVREKGSFGFVVKGCNPAYIESVDTNGPAQTAGLRPGDFLIKLNGLDIRRCDHDRLVQLLQDSGSTPTLQVLRCQDGQPPVLSPAGSVTSLHTFSSESSHASDLMPFEQNHMDTEGKTFTQHAEFLLTSKERLQLKRGLQQYELNRDVVALHAGLEPVLDTPSKCTLWKYVLVQVQPHHHDYILHRVGLPSHLLTELIDHQANSRDTNRFSSTSANDTEGGGPVPSRRSSAHSLSTLTAGSFQQQIDFLLTSRERMQFKAAVQTYQDNQDLRPLMEVLGQILDTPSKRVLWRYVLLHLTPAHRGVVTQIMDLPDAHTVSGLSLSAMDSYIGSYDENSQQVDTATNTEEEVLYGEEKDKDNKQDASSSDEDDVASSTESDSGSKRRSVKGKPQSGGRGAGAGGREDTALFKELLATRRAVEEVKEAITARAEDKDRNSSLDDEDDDDEEDDNSDDNDEVLDTKHFVTIIPVGYPGFDVGRRPFYSKEIDSPEFSKLRKFVTDKRDGEPSGTEARGRRGRFKDAGSGNRDSGSDSDTDLVFSVQASGQQLSESFNHTAMVALKELDDVMATETVSDPECSPSGKMPPSVVFCIPPPPPLPPPTADFGLGEKTGSGQQMNVKRINWEKLDNRNVENTIWEQLCESDLAEVIRYLELESQFSTKPYRPREKKKKKEVCIMNSKKAYNISILLGHLKMSVGEIRQAIYLMDEETLTPELLPQLITYAPSKQEITHYDNYNGDVEELSKPDQFSFQRRRERSSPSFGCSHCHRLTGFHIFDLTEMSQIYGYEQRLKALLYKCNFQEKVEEMKENLRSIRMASYELRHSKKLARLLELILAMGNYMNKGNNRVGEAAGFRITFLTQLDTTKTADGKSTFLHVLADTCYNRFPELLTLAQDLGTLAEAIKMPSVAISLEIQELRKGLQEISTALEKIGNHAHGLTSTDHFQDIMGHFLSEASDEIQGLLRLQAAVMDDFGGMVVFFGEDPTLVTTADIFDIFYNFVDKFEKAHRHNMMYKRH